MGLKKNSGNANNAKAKKQTLVQDKSLAQALVPEDERPYPVPENWIWVRLLSTFSNVTSSQKKLQQKEYLEDGLFAIVDQGKELVGGYTNNENLLYDGSLPVIVFGDHTRIVKYIDFPFVQGADGVKVLCPYTFMGNKFFYYAIQNADIPDLGYRRHFPLFSQFCIPLPPLPEQQRIVNRIESLFEKLDRAKELAQNALDSFETRKAAILHKAFTGELTAKWREENGVGMGGWEEKTLGAVMRPMKTKKPQGEYFRYIDIDSVDNSTQKIDLPKKLPTRNAPSRASREIQEGDILFSMVRPYLKNIAYIDESLSDCIASTGFYVCKPSDEVHPLFLFRFLTSDKIIMDINSHMKGHNSPSVRKEDIENTLINLPTLPEQQEIVRILDSLFEKEQQAHELCNVIDKIDLMKKAILARAFRGELGTNVSGEESALRLLGGEVG